MKKITPAGINFIKDCEGFKSSPYLCSAGVPTIGYGTTYYPNGKKVTLRDKSITEAEALDILLSQVNTKYVPVVNIYIRSVEKQLTDNQFDALVSFAYNLGNGALQKSTLLKLVLANPNNSAIANEFTKWIYADGEKSKGLLARRQKEVKMYFSK